MARPWVHCIDKIAGYVPPKDRLDSIEKEGLELATAATLYQHGGSLDARVLLLSCCAGIAIPRILKYIDQQEEKKNAEKSAPVNDLAQLTEMVNKLKTELEESKRVKSSTEVKPLPAISYGVL